MIRYFLCLFGWHVPTITIWDEKICSNCDKYLEE